jgi:NADH dehydrogenase
MILVTGATGRLGGNVVRLLRQVGLGVRALVRAGSEYFWLNDTGANYFFADLRDPGSLRRACKGQDYLIACDAIIVEGRENRHDNVTLAGKQALWEAAKTRGIKRVVYISCLGVSRNPSTASLQAKLQAEQALVESGLEYVILRPSVYTQQFADMARTGRDHGYVPLPAPGSNLVSPISLRDVAVYALASLDLEAVKNQVIEIGGPDTMTAREALDHALGLAEANGARVLPLSTGLSKATEQIIRVSSWRWANRLADLQVLFGDDLSVDMSELTKTFNIELTPYADAIKQALEETHPRDFPNARDERVIHRQFAATVYRPGVDELASLPDGPLRYDE